LRIITASLADLVKLFEHRKRSSIYGRKDAWSPSEVNMRVIRRLNQTRSEMLTISHDSQFLGVLEIPTMFEVDSRDLLLRRDTDLGEN
jgi:hypothetical protein